MAKTSIEWTDFSINPIRARLGDSVGHYCEKISTGCKNCYSSRFQPRFGLPQFQEQRTRDDIEPFLEPSALEEVLRRRKPTKWFWCDMTDMFGDWVPFEWVAACFGVMAATPRHTHQVLTKRPGRALEFFEWVSRLGKPWLTCRVGMLKHAEPPRDTFGPQTETPWPLPNVWLGASVENQAAADERIPELLKCPAVIRWLSCEPLLGPVKIDPGYLGCKGHLAETFGNPLIHWAVIGGESGAGARPMQPDWARSLRDQFVDAGVALHFKQWGNHAPGPEGKLIRFRSKKLGGRLLDGRIWDEFPEVRP